MGGGEWEGKFVSFRVDYSQKGVLDKFGKVTLSERLSIFFF